MLESDRLFSVSRISMVRQGKQVGLATGFFLARGQDRYFVTNHHVVMPKDKNARPDKLRVRIHTDRNNLRANQDLDIPLYDGSAPRWREHSAGGSVDVVAIPIDVSTLKGLVCPAISLDSELPKQARPSLAQAAYVIGYPMGFMDDVHNLPIVRGVSIASRVDVDFREEPCFVVDGKLQEGMSGSPVFVTVIPLDTGTGVIDVNTAPKPYFAGVFSAYWSTPKGDSLGLNKVWRTDVLHDIFAH